MRISFSTVLFIILLAVALGLLINFLQPNGLPLINKVNNTEIKEMRTATVTVDSSKKTFSDTVVAKVGHKISGEKTQADYRDAITPEYNFSEDSASGNQKVDVTGGHELKEDKDPTPNNLTEEVFNQPRLISLSQAYELYRDKTLFIDARDTEEFDDGHISGAINIPYLHADEYLTRLDPVVKMEPVVVYCEGADCDMSIRLGNELFSKGYKKVFIFFGGWEEWERSGYPVVKSSGGLELN